MLNPYDPPEPEIARLRLSRKKLGLVLLLAALYVSSYVVLSRESFAHADALDFGGFYFLPPENSNQWRIANYALVCFYYPLILIDNWIGTGRPIGSEPLWGLASGVSAVPESVHSPLRKL